MTPLEYARRYWELEVPIEEGLITHWVKVRVATYLRWSKDNKTASKDAFLNKVRPHINTKGETIKVKVRTVWDEVQEKTYTSRSELAENAVDAFYGKGSPEEVQVTLQLAVRYGLLKKEQLPDYCAQEHIGLDCSGFVGNYLRHAVLRHPWDSDPGKKSKEVGASSGIRQMMAWGQPVTKVEDINARAIYLMALVNSAGHVIESRSDPVGHIMITQPGTLTSRLHNRAVKVGGQRFVGWSEWHANRFPALQVVESTGGVGLVESYYLILDVDKGVFTVFRGSKQAEMKVRIHRLHGT